MDLLNAEIEYFNARLAYTTGQYAKLASAFRIFAGLGTLLSQLWIALPIDAVKVREQTAASDLRKVLPITFA